MPVNPQTIDRRLHRVALALGACLALALASCGGGSGHHPVPTSTATPTPTQPASATPTPANTATASASATASQSATPPPTDTPTASPTATENLLRLPALHAEPDANNGGRIVDAEGRQVLLRGVNVNALVDYWQGSQFQTVFPLADADTDLMAAIGLDCVRLLVSWSRVEPAPGVYNDDYLQQAAATVRRLAARGLYSIIDLHQDAWSATLAAPPDQVCPPNNTPALGWDGAPAWATLDGGMLRCAPAGIRELSPAVLSAVANFFADAPGPGGIGIRTRYVAMLAHVASVLAPESGVAGYDLMNEPNAFTPTQMSQLSALYADALQAVRAAEAQAGIPPRLILFEPSALWSAVGRGAPPDFARDRDVVYAPHIYTGGLNNTPLTAGAFQIARDEAQGFGGAPVLSGEWGGDPRRASDPTDTYFLDHQQLEDQFLFGATLWTWHESCGDPHKQADIRAGQLPYVWGEFEVDCTTNQITGLRQDLIDELTRAYVRAAPGMLFDSTYDFTSGAFTVRATAAPAGGELLVFYPAARHGAPTLTSTGLLDLHTAPAPGGGLYISAHAAGGDWGLDAQ